MPKSAFDDRGLRAAIAGVVAEAKALYLADEIPWVVGYSGGKDSTAVLQLVWTMLRELASGERHKPVYVISTDTLVENPVVARWVTTSLEMMERAALEQALPVEPHRLTPDVANTFWVNLIGRGYPAPRPKFRWCTERLKIKPSNAFIRRVVRENGEAILVLGTRKAESSGRRHRMEQLEGGRIRERLSPNDSLPNSLVYSPIEDWTNDNVWLYLMQVDNPWGYDNKDLMAMYRGASADNECPLVVDSSTPSCGDSRFGCWVCTLVDKDKSMSAMIQNDEEKEWMLPLLELRDALDVSDDRPLRDFRRMNGNVQLFHDRPIPGPYTEDARHEWLRRLLDAQVWIRGNGPDYVRGMELISMGELHEIRRIWVFEKHEIEDALPRIYQEVTGEPFPGPTFDDVLVLTSDDLAVLRELCVEDKLHYQLTRDLLDVERQFRTMTRRAGLFEALERSFRRSYFDDEQDAVGHARRLRGASRRRHRRSRRLPGLIVLLRQVVLHNFAGYRGRHVVDLVPPTEHRPVILFGGLNGAGKTSLLDALQLVLYGKRARCVGRGNLPYEEYLRRSINRGVSDREGAAIELAFDATFDGQLSSFRVHRSWERTGSAGVREHVSVTRDGVDSPLLTGRWDELVEELLPLEISSLFFFDGEKIEALADPDRAGRVIATAVEALLGLNLLDRLGVDLIALERRKRTIAADHQTRQEIAALDAVAAGARAERARAAQEQAVRQNEVDRAHADLRRAEQAFRREGGDLYDRRTEIEQRRRAAADRLSRIGERMLDLAAGPLPLRLVRDLLGQVVDQERSEKEAQRADILRDVLVGRDRNLLTQFAAELAPDLAMSVEKFLDADRAARSAAADLPRYLHLTEDLGQRLSFVWQNELERAATEVAALLLQRSDVQAEIDEADRQLAAVPSADAIAVAALRRDKCMASVAEAKARLTVAGELVAIADRAVADGEAKLQRAYRDASETLAGEEDARRIVDHAARVRTTLEQFRSALLERHLNRIEAAVLDSLKKLLRKQRLVADLRLDPKTFELELFDDEGRAVPTERLSAGERQILAVAMLWGLARVSTRKLPMVIDTPLGRLDSTHRRLIVERYFPHASHQVLLLSTDEEIDEDLLKALGPAIGRTYELRHDDSEGCTQIVDGYFWKVKTDVA